jgi:hypothetical protein
MSWGKEQFKKAYNRASERQDLVREQRLDELENYFDIWAMMREQDYSDEMTPTMREIRIGWLLTLLSELQLKSAKIALCQHYW